MSNIKSANTALSLAISFCIAVLGFALSNPGPALAFGSNSQICEACNYDVGDGECTSVKVGGKKGCYDDNVIGCGYTGESCVC